MSNRTEGYYVNLNKPGLEKGITYIFTHVKAEIIHSFHTLVLETRKEKEKFKSQALMQLKVVNIF